MKEELENPNPHQISANSAQRELFPSPAKDGENAEISAMNKLLRAGES